MEVILKADAYFSGRTESPGKIIKECLLTVSEKFSDIEICMGDIKSKPLMSSIRSVGDRLSDSSFGNAYWFSFTLIIDEDSNLDLEFKSELEDVEHRDVNIRKVRTLGELDK
jgi:hypothetical protein